MLERLTWNEIEERYPNQWVGLTNVILKPNDTTNVESAVVQIASDNKFEVEKEIYLNYDGLVLCRHTNSMSLPLMNVANW